MCLQTVRFSILTQIMSDRHTLPECVCLCVDVNAEQGEEVNSGGGSGLQKHIINSNNTNLIL